jgi:oligopeptide transport system permease protein
MRSTRWQSARGRALRGALLLLGALLIAAIVGSAVSPYSYQGLDWAHIALPPQMQTAHWLGTDRLGRDLFVRLVQALRISLAIGVLAALISVLLGALWGAMAGYIGGHLGNLMMRCVDALYAIPLLFIVIALMTVFERGNAVVVCVAVGACGWLTMARIVYGETLKLRQQEFIEAAIALGLTRWAVLRRHLLPNLIPVMIAYGTLFVPQAILAEGFLSFLGLGVQEPLASIGSLLNEGARDMESAPWILFVPATLLVLVLLSLNVIGDALNDALSPQSRSA